MDERLVKAARAIVEHFDGGQLWLSRNDAAVTRLRQAVAALDRTTADQTEAQAAEDARRRGAPQQQGGG